MSSNPTVTALSVIIALLFVCLAASILACIVFCMRNRYISNDLDIVSRGKFDAMSTKCEKAEKSAAQHKGDANDSKKDCESYKTRYESEYKARLAAESTKADCQNKAELLDVRMKNQNTEYTRAQF